MYCGLGSIAAAVLMCATQAMGASYSYSGSFAKDNDTVLVRFSLLAAAKVSFISFGYAGGVQADGTEVAAGGFDTILALFDADGFELGQNDDGADVPADPATGVASDAKFALTLGAGFYALALAQYDNFANERLQDGFYRDADATFTAAQGCSNGRFCDYFGNNRTARYAFDIVGVDLADAPLEAEEIDVEPVPLPASLPLLAGGAAFLGLARRRR